MGRSAAEIGRLSAHELMEWAVFEEEYGPLTMGERIDHMAALVAFTAHATAGGKMTMDEFVPRWQRAQKVEPDIIGWLSARA